jgi:uncharacterized protein (DUF58 family)
MFDFEKLDREDLSKGESQPNAEGSRSILDHRWVWMGLVVFGLGLVLRNVQLITLTAFMLGTVCFCLLWSRGVLQNTYYTRSFHHRRAFPGEEVSATVVIENRKLLPMTWAQIEDEWPTAFAPADESLLTASAVPQMNYLVNVYSLRWTQRVRRRYVLLAKTRGIYSVGPAHVISGDPFSLFERGATFQKGDILIVYPTIKPIHEFGLDPKDPFGELRSPVRLFEDPSRVRGVRDYAHGDSLRTIHWKATARAGQLQVREEEPTRSMTLALCLNVASYEQHWQGILPEQTEHLISVAASLAAWGLERNYAVGVAANATLVQAEKGRSLLAAPGRGRNQLTYILETLAGVSYFISRDYAQFLLEQSARLPWGCTIVVMSMYFNESIQAAVLQLRVSGRRVIIVGVGEKPPPESLEGIRYHLPL